MPTLSVVIPTHRRAAILAKCLQHLERQTIVNDIEVIVVSDGHDPETAALFHDNPGFTFRIPHLRFFEVEKSQQGVARNKGVAEAVAPYILFIGDDIFLPPNGCESQVAACVAMHDERSPVVLLNRVDWDPACGITPVMEWLAISGWQFDFGGLHSYQANFVPRFQQHKYTYTSYLSLPAEVARKFPFRTDIRLYGWEDVEWGIRLRDAGVRLFYFGATALHHHHITLEQSLERMHTLGRSAMEFKQKVPEFDRVPTGLKLLAYRLFARFPTLAGAHRKAFLEGLAAAN